MVVLEKSGTGRELNAGAQSQFSLNVSENHLEILLKKPKPLGQLQEAEGAGAEGAQRGKFDFS